MCCLKAQSNPIITLSLLRRIGLLVLCVQFLAFPVLTAWGEDYFTVEIRGVDEKKLHAALLEQSQLERIRNKRDLSVTALETRAEKETALLLEVLRGFGYYQATATSTVEKGEIRPVVVFSVTTGVPYLVSELSVSAYDATGVKSTDNTWIPRNFPLKKGDFAETAKILDGEAFLVAAARDEGWPLAHPGDRKVVVDHAAHSVAVAYVIQLGHPANFGATQIAGLEGMEAAPVLAMLPWKAGERYRRSLLEKGREKLLASGLFATASLEPGAAVDADGGIPINVTVTERKHRTVSFGVQYRTDEGIGAQTGWQHRNLFGRAHRLTLGLNTSEIDQSITAKYEFPGFLREDQTLSLNFKASNESPDAYDSRATELGAWVERRISRQLTIGGGPKLRLSHVEQSDEGETYFTASLPVEATRDTRENPLDPSNGLRLGMRAEPHVVVSGPGAAFLKNEFQWSGYHSFDEDARWVLAGRLKLGMLAGAGLMDVPPDARFYAGGGGSVRGFGYQRIGDINCDDEPVGGRSLAECSLELRRKLNDRLGLAVFLDGGSVYESALPDFSGTPRWGAGMGLRYFTPIGPLRLDVAAPLNPRGGIDSSMQFYVSMGQAF